MTDEQICTKLAEFGGFKWIDIKQTVMRRGKIEGYWESPIHGRGSRHYYTPNFLDPIQGMGLMFKYVIPKFLYCSLQFHGMTYVADVALEFANHIVESGIDPTRDLVMAVYKAIKEG